MQLRVSSRRLFLFLLAQFLGALNDNALKMIVSLAAFDFFASQQGQISYLSAASAVFIVPFLLVSVWAGRLVDGHSTSTLLKLFKIIEIPIVLLAFAAFYTGYTDILLLVALFLMAAQSAVFSPAKYSYLPEVLPPQKLQKVNAMMLLFTYVAILGGTVMGASLYGRAAADPWALLSPLLAMSIVGVASILWIQKTPPKTLAHVHAPLRAAWQELRGQAILRLSFVGQALFWFTGAFLYLVYITTGQHYLALNATQSGMIFAYLAGGIMLGSVGAVVVKRYIAFRHAITLAAGLLVLGLGMTCFALDSLALLHIAAVMTGLGGGLWMIPLVTAMQQHTTITVRGRILALTSMHNMFWVLMTSVLFWLGHGVLAMALAPLVWGVVALLIVAIALCIVYNIPKL